MKECCVSGNSSVMCTNLTLKYLRNMYSYNYMIQDIVGIEVCRDLTPFFISTKNQGSVKPIHTWMKCVLI